MVDESTDRPLGEPLREVSDERMDDGYRRDEFGFRIDDQGHRVDEEGNRVNADGEKIDIYGDGEGGDMPVPPIPPRLHQ
jgi:hypothetical protein